eukprot:13581118-Alexandrium_andersonii.AAC.1
MPEHASTSAALPLVVEQAAAADDRIPVRLRVDLDMKLARAARLLIVPHLPHTPWVPQKRDAVEVEELLLGATTEEAGGEGRGPIREAHRVTELRPVPFQLHHHESRCQLRLLCSQATEGAAGRPGGGVVLKPRSFPRQGALQRPCEE